MLLGYSRLLLWEFRWSLTVFTSMVLLCGLVFQQLHHEAGHDVSYPKACYAVFMMVFGESVLEFPEDQNAWLLGPLFFLIPLVGLGAMAEVVIRMAYLIFAAKRQLQEWQIMLASLYRDHVVVLGMGRAGVQIVRGLQQLGEQVVAIDQDRENPFLEEIRDLNVPVIIGDGRQKRTLEQTNLAKAQAFIAATSDDLANLDAVLTARDLYPDLRVVVRLFDDTLANKVARVFNIPAISTARVSADSFIAAATRRVVYHSFTLGGKEVQLSDLVIHAGSDLEGTTVDDLQADGTLNVVMHQSGKDVRVNPTGKQPLLAGDHIMVIAQIGPLVKLQHRNAERLDRQLSTRIDQPAASVPAADDPATTRPGTGDGL